MGWGEATRLLRLLATDPSAQTCAAVSGWAYPLDRGALTMATVAENIARSAGDKRFHYPRPWDEKPKVLGTASMSVAQMRAFLDKHRAQNTSGAGQVVTVSRP
jgi:hypothetical protein